MMPEEVDKYRRGRGTPQRNGRQAPKLKDKVGPRRGRPTGCRVMVSLALALLPSFSVHCPGARSTRRLVLQCTHTAQRQKYAKGSDRRSAVDLARPRRRVSRFCTAGQQARMAAGGLPLLPGLNEV